MIVRFLFFSLVSTVTMLKSDFNFNGVTITVNIISTMIITIITAATTIHTALVIMIVIVGMHVSMTDTQANIKLVCIRQYVDSYQQLSLHTLACNPLRPPSQISSFHIQNGYIAIQKPE